MSSLTVVQPNKIFIFLFLFICLFPYLSFGTNNMDTQPWPFISSALYLLYIIISWRFSLRTFLIIPATILIVSSSIIISALYYETFSLNFDLLRGIYGYLTFTFIFVVYYHIYKRYGFQARWFFIANIIWLLVGLFQVAIDPYIFDFLVNVRTSGSRGVTGLSPEPTFYAFFLFFMNFIYLIQFNYKLNGMVKKLFTLNILFIFLVAQSSSVILLFFVGIMFFLIYRADLKVFLLMVFSIISLILILDNFNSNARLLNILSILFKEGPLYLLSHDMSVFARIMSIIYPYYSGMSNYLVPGGFNSLASIPPMELFILDYNFTFDIDSKTMSYFGAIFYELGFFSLLVFLFFFKCIYNGTFRSVFEFVFLIFCLQFALTIAYSLIPILLVTFYFRNLLINDGELYVQR